MAQADDQMSPCGSGGAGEKFRKKPFRPENYEEPQYVSQETEGNVSCLTTNYCGTCGGISATAGKSELELMLKQMTFTRSEAQHFISLLHSRTIEEESTPLLKVEESITSGSRKRRKYGDERPNYHASVVGSKVLEEEIASPADLVNTYKSSNICKQDSKLINDNATSTFQSSGYM